MRRWAPAVVAAASFVAFAPVLRDGFVYWDDPTYVADNPWIRGLTLEHFRWAITATRGGFWQPLTWLSFQFDYSLWGLNPAGFHATNLLLHAAAAVVFYFVALELLGGRTKAALLAALFFALHPLRVESVAWVTERKGLLSGLFFLLAALSWLKGRARLAFGAFLLSLTAKSTGLTLPFVLLILECLRAKGLPGRRALTALAPFFVASAAAAALTWAVALAGGIVVDITPLGLAWRAGRALYGLCFYPLATAWPAGRSAYSPPKPWFGRWSWEFFACALAPLAAAALCWRERRRRPGLAAALAAYTVMILPVLGFVQQGQLYSACDRFSYLPGLSFALLFGAALSRDRRATALAAVWLLALGAATWRQSGVWRDTLTLWTSAQENAPGTLPLGEKGAALLKLGRVEEGIALLREATQGPRPQPTAFVNLGAALSKLGREEEARAAWSRGLAVSPSEEIASLLARSRASELHNRGNALLAQGRTMEAEKLYREALRLDPGLSPSRVNLGNILARRGAYADAAAFYREALKTDPRSVEARANLDAVSALLRK